MKNVFLLVFAFVLVGCALPPVEFKPLTPDSMSVTLSHPNVQVVDVKSFDAATVGYPTGTTDSTFNMIPVGPYLINSVLTRVRPSPDISLIRLTRFQTRCSGEGLALVETFCSGEISVLIRRKGGDQMLGGSMPRRRLGYTPSAWHGGQDAILDQTRKLIDAIVFDAKFSPA